MAATFLDAIKNRRSIYSLSNEEVVPRERVEEIVQHAILHTPSPFNMQSTRLVVLFGQHSKKLWQITLDALKKVTDAEQFVQTEQKVNGSFASGYGTVLFFEDQSVVNHMSAQFPLYAENFAVWSQHSNAMHQFVVWSALEAEGLGASLQHYNPLIDDGVKTEWKLPDSWRLVAQMPFGKPLQPAGEKQFNDLEPRLKVFR